MRLYSFWSPNPQKVRFALGELGLPCEVVAVDLFAGEQKADSVRALNPMRKVPILEDGALVLWESNAILAYLGEKTGRLWPGDPAGRAEALKWLFLESRHLSEPAGNLWFNDSVAAQAGRPVDAAAAAAAARALVAPLGVLEGHLAERRWMLGDDLSLVDCGMGTILAALAASRFDWSAYPAVWAYVARIRARPAWQATGPRY